MVEHLGHPAVLTGLKVLAGPLQDGIGTAHVFHIFAGGLHRGQHVQVRGIAVEPAQIIVVHGLGIVVEAAVIAAQAEDPLQFGRQTQGLRDLQHGLAFIGQMQGLVIDVAVQVPHQAQLGTHPFRSPDGPVVHAVQDLRLAAPALQALVQGTAPAQGIARLGPAQGVEVVHGVGAVLGGGQGLELRDVPVHLRRGLGVGCQLEDEGQAVQLQGLAILFDEVGGLQQARRAAGGGQPQPGAHMPARRGRQQGAVHVLGPAAHGIAGQHVFGHGRFHEALGRDDPHLAGGYVLFIHHAVHAAVMVHMAVGIDDGHHRLVRPVGVIELEGRRGVFGGDERIDHDDAAVALDDGHVGKVGIADLVEAVHDLVEAVAQHQLALPPQGRIDRIRRLGGHDDRRRKVAAHGRGQKIIGGQVPGLAAVGVEDAAPVRQGSQKAALGILKILPVGKVHFFAHGRVGGTGVLRGRFAHVRGIGSRSRPDNTGAAGQQGGAQGRSQQGTHGFPPSGYAREKAGRRKADLWRDPGAGRIPLPDLLPVSRPSRSKASGFRARACGRDRPGTDKKRPERLRPLGMLWGRGHPPQDHMLCSK